MCSFVIYGCFVFKFAFPNSDISPMEQVVLEQFATTVAE